MPIVSNGICESMFARAGRQESIPDIFVCAGYENGGHDSCQGDSGGPLQVGVTTFWLRDNVFNIFFLKIFFFFTFFLMKRLNPLTAVSSWLALYHGALAVRRRICPAFARASRVSFHGSWKMYRDRPIQ